LTTTREIFRRHAIRPRQRCRKANEAAANVGRQEAGSVDPISRRSLLARGGAGVAGAAAASTGILGLAKPAGAATLSAAELAVLDQPVMLRVRNAASGEVELLVGEREVVFTDKSLVANVLRASR